MSSGRETMTCTGNGVSDGTFKCCAKFFLQMYNIHGLCSGHYVPLVFVLLPGKSVSIYSSMWSAIRSLREWRNLTLEPTTVHIDFKVAINTVLNNVQCTFKTSYN